MTVEKEDHREEEDDPDAYVLALADEAAAAAGVTANADSDFSHSYQSSNSGFADAPWQSMPPWDEVATLSSNHYVGVLGDAPWAGEVSGSSYTSGQWSSASSSAWSGERDALLGPLLSDVKMESIMLVVAGEAAIAGRGAAGALRVPAVGGGPCHASLTDAANAWAEAVGDFSPEAHLIQAFARSPDEVEHQVTSVELWRSSLRTHFSRLQRLLSAAVAADELGVFSRLSRNDVDRLLEQNGPMLTAYVALRMTQATTLRERLSWLLLCDLTSSTSTALTSLEFRPLSSKELEAILETAGLDAQKG